MCQITGCQGKVVARGLCAKHYMRVRRTGDPHLTKKPGRPREQNVVARDLFGGTWSPRTVARYAAAMKNLDQCSAEARVNAFKSCHRSNGTINVSQLLERSTELWWLEHQDPTASRG